MVIDKTVANEKNSTNLNIIDRFIKQLESFSYQIMHLSNIFTSISKHIGKRIKMISY